MASYHNELKALAESIGSDGCTGVVDIVIECCWEHDWAYVTGMTPRGVAISKEQADRRFRNCLQAHLMFRWLSPISWIRYYGVVLLGRGIWNKRLIQVEKFISDYDFNKIQLNDARNSRIRIYNDLMKSHV